MLDRGQLVGGLGGRLWMDGVIFDITERREAEESLRRREIEAARTAELRASRDRIVAAADAARQQDRARPARRRAAAARDARARRAARAQARLRTEPDSAGPFLDRLAKELSETSAELRELARGIHPAVLTERGLLPAIEALGGPRAGARGDPRGPIERLSPTLEVTAYFTVSEALTNVAKYARASHATVRLAVEDGALVIEVGDDGVGGARAGVGSGLSGLADRVGACDGTLSVTSQPGEGTLVRAVLPLDG